VERAVGFVGVFGGVLRVLFREVPSAEACNFARGVIRIRKYTRGLGRIELAIDAVQDAFGIEDTREASRIALRLFPSLADAAGATNRKETAMGDIGIDSRALDETAANAQARVQLQQIVERHDGMLREMLRDLPVCELATNFERVVVELRFGRAPADPIKATEILRLFRPELGDKAQGRALKLWPELFDDSIKDALAGK